MRIPSTSNTAQSGQAGGTLGGVGGRTGIGARPGVRSMQLGDAGYLWVLVLAEAGLVAWLRAATRRHHGG